VTDSVFTKIIKGELPGFKIHESDRSLAILNIHPITPGHTLVIPKRQIDSFYDLDQADYLDLMLLVQRVAKQLNSVLKPKRVGLKVIGLDVPHAHIHVIAFNNLDEYSRIEDQMTPIDQAALKTMAAKLAF
jgi:histidine triad (HIT) family protein